MKIVLDLSETDFEECILGTQQPILVDFYANWCSPCRMQSPIFYELASELKDRVVFAKVDVDENEALAHKYKITSIPCILLFKDGRVVSKAEGLCTKAELAEMLIKYI